MRKLHYILFVFLLPFFVTAQPYSNRDKLLITSRIDTLLQNYMIKGLLSEPGANKQSLKVIKEFKSLFAEGAMVFDDINAEYQDDGNGYPYKLKDKTRNVFFDELIEQFPQGLAITNGKINISYETIDKGFVLVALERNITAVRLDGKYNLFNNDTLLIKLNIQNDKTVKISNIKSLGSNLKVLNDLDLDGIIDPLDECKDEKGKISLKGCPDRDSDGIPDKSDDCPDQAGAASNRGCPQSTFAYQFVFSGSVGATLNFNSFDKAKPADLPYNQEILDRNHTVVAVKNPSLQFSNLNLSANIAYYYGKKQFSRNKGISLGFMFTNYNATYDLSGSKMVFKALLDSVNNPAGYRRILSLNSFREKTNFTTLNFQLMYRIKTKFGSKLAGELGFGPSFNLITAKTKIEPDKIYVEGYLQYNENGSQFYNADAAPTYSDVPIIKDSIVQQPIGSPSPTQLFKNLNERSSLYDYGSDLGKLNTLDKTIVRTGISLNVNADLFYHVAPKVAIKLGFVFVYAPDALGISGKGAKLDKDDPTPDTYNTIFNSGSAKQYTAFGLNLGLIIGIRTAKKN